MIRRLVARYRERYAKVGYSENTLYAGVTDVLTALHERGIKMAVCTSKRKDFAERILELFEIRHLVGFVDGGDVGVTKTQQLGRLSSSGFVGPGATMIGDRAVDILAARENGLSSVGVLWGYGSEAELRDAGAEVIVDEVGALLRLAGTY